MFKNSVSIVLSRFSLLIIVFMSETFVLIKSERGLYHWRDSNPQSRWAVDFKSTAYASSATVTLVIPQGIEPWTHRLKVCCSTGWATESFCFQCYQRYEIIFTFPNNFFVGLTGLEPITCRLWVGCSNHWATSPFLKLTQYIRGSNKHEVLYLFGLYCYRMILWNRTRLFYPYDFSWLVSILKIHPYICRVFYSQF